MAQSTGFFTGEKKKKKKGSGNVHISTAPVFIPPTIQKKGKERD